MKSRFTLRLALAFAVCLSCLAITGCTTGSPEASAPPKHVHSPWRYAHMNHMHTRPTSKDQKPLFPSCMACTNKDKAPGASRETPEAPVESSENAVR